jgi:hypothetical protein
MLVRTYFCVMAKRKMLIFLLISMLCSNIYSQVLSDYFTWNSTEYVNTAPCADTEIIRRYTSPLNVTDLDLGPDGELLLFSFTERDGRVYRSIIEPGFGRLNQPGVEIPFEVYNRNDGYVALGNGGSDLNVITAMTLRKMIQINIKDSIISPTVEIAPSIRISGDVTWVDDKLFAITLNDSITQIAMLERDDVTNVLNSKRALSFPGIINPAIGVEWAEDCSEKYLVAIWRKYISDNQDTFVQQVTLLNTNFETVEESCPILLILSEGDGPKFEGLASYDNHIQTCELRLDLDADNSGYRFGPHFWQELRCTRSYPVADEDVGLRSLVGALDSITVKLRSAGSQVGEDLLRYPATKRLMVRNYGDTLLHLIATEQTTDQDFIDYLPQIRLEVTAPEVILGERVIETFAFAGGLRSDQARTFIQVMDPDTGGDAGRDSDYVSCGIELIDGQSAIGPGARRGGTWTPSLNLDDFWDPNEHDYGVYRYTVLANDCPADTSYMTISPPSSLVPLLPHANTALEVCENKPFIWSVDLPQVDSVRWEDGTGDRLRLLNRAGRYHGIVYGYGGCQTDTISLDLLTIRAPRPTFSQQRLCEGDVVQLADGTRLTSDTTIVTRFDNGLACDSVHNAIYVFRPIREVTTMATICAGDTLSWRGELLTLAGTYERVSQAGPCDTLLRLELDLRPPDTARVDTLIRDGEVLFLYGQEFTMSGTYELFEPKIGDCGLLTLLTVDFITSTLAPNALADQYWYPSLLKAGSGALRFSPFSSQTSVSVEKLVVYDLLGRQLFSSIDAQAWLPPANLPGGVYVFQVRLRVNGHLMERVGKIVVNR